MPKGEVPRRQMITGHSDAPGMSGGGDAQLKFSLCNKRNCVGEVSSKSRGAAAWQGGKQGRIPGGGLAEGLPKRKRASG